MVAAWMSAETGVGPSIASASHGYSGIWADLPTAPPNNSSPMATSEGSPTEPRLANTLWYSRLPVRSYMRNNATRKAASPKRLKIIAFFATLEALSRSNQKPMRKYEQTPTPSQPKNMSRKLSASTKTSIEATNRFRYKKNLGKSSSCSM